VQDVERAERGARVLVWIVVLIIVAVVAARMLSGG
jgi:hypothetical protein